LVRLITKSKIRFILLCPSASQYTFLPVFSTFNGGSIGLRKVKCRACSLQQLANQEMLHGLPGATDSMFSVVGISQFLHIMCAESV